MFQHVTQFPKGIEVVGSAVIENAQGKILLVKSPKWRNKWTMPGGHIEPGETIEEAALREVKEETGINVRIIKFVHEWTGDHNGEKLKSFTYVCSTDSDKVTLSDEHGDYAWVNVKDLPNWSDKTNFSMQDWPAWIVT